MTRLSPSRNPSRSDQTRPNWHQDLTLARPRVDQQPYRIGSILRWVRIKRTFEPLKLFNGQPCFPSVLMEPLDAAAGIVRSQFPFDRPGGSVPDLRFGLGPVLQFLPALAAARFVRLVGALSDLFFDFARSPMALPIAVSTDVTTLFTRSRFGFNMDQPCLSG